MSEVIQEETAVSDSDGKATRIEILVRRSVDEIALMTDNEVHNRLTAIRESPTPFVTIRVGAIRRAGTVRNFV